MCLKVLGFLRNLGFLRGVPRPLGSEGPYGKDRPAHSRLVSLAVQPAPPGQGRRRMGVRRQPGNRPWAQISRQRHWVRSE